MNGTQPILRRLFFTLFSIFIVGLSAQNRKFTLVLDAGHGGSDHGATRSYDSLGVVREKDITLAVVKKLGKILEIRNPDIKVIYTRTTDIYPSLSDRTNMANRNKADFFISVHCNSSARPTAYGTETYVQGPDQNRTNLEVAKNENDIILLDEKDKRTFARYDPTSKESLIAMKIQQSKYLEKSLIMGQLIEDNFVNRNKRYSRGVMQKNLHVLRLNAMPSVLIETGFINYPSEAAYLASEKGQNEIAESIYEAIITYRQGVFKAETPKETSPKVEEEPNLPNPYRILLMSTTTRMEPGDPRLNGMKEVLITKQGRFYSYYTPATYKASVRSQMLKTAQNAGFRQAIPTEFVMKKLDQGYYAIEIAVSDRRLSDDSPVMQALGKDALRREKEDGLYYYFYGKFKSFEDVANAQREMERKGIKSGVIVQFDR